MFLINAPIGVINVSVASLIASQRALESISTHKYRNIFLFCSKPRVLGENCVKQLNITVVEQYAHFRANSNEK